LTRRGVPDTGALDWGSWNAFRETNDRGVGRLLEACAAISLDRFVHISTLDVYGYPDRDGLDETTPCRDRGLPYNSTKIAGERHSLLPVLRDGSRSR